MNALPTLDIPKTRIGQMAIEMLQQLSSNGAQLEPHIDLILDWRIDPEDLEDILAKLERTAARSKAPDLIEQRQYWQELGQGEGCTVEAFVRFAEYLFCGFSETIWAIKLIEK